MPASVSSSAILCILRGRLNVKDTPPSLPLLPSAWNATSNLISASVRSQPAPSSLFQLVAIEKLRFGTAAMSRTLRSFRL